MEALWYGIIAVMVAVYVVLDGFDLGAGAAHFFVARNDGERREVFGAIGPVWDGNEVWLLAGGAVLFFAFPRAYASGFSGFYLPLMLVLWLLVLRGVFIEFRSHHENPLWRAFWDAGFAVSSAVLAIVLGAALGNLIRGVPVDGTGYFHVPFFTSFGLGPRPGVLDWYTVLAGVFTLLVLTAHGATYLVWKTSGAVQSRSVRLALGAWLAAAVVGVLSTIATAYVQPALYAKLGARPWIWVLILAMLAGLVLALWGLTKKQELPAFLGSSLFIIGMLASTAALAFPEILISTLDPSFTLHAYNSATGAYGMTVGLGWWIPGILLAAAYYTIVFRSFRGKVASSKEGGGY